MKAVSKKASGLSERQKTILRSIVESYISKGEPIGSNYLLQSYNMSCSSATIRAEMAELEKMGYLVQPHASAGRAPTQLGYRFYVDTLMDNYKLTAMEIVELNDMLKNKFVELDTMLDTATKLVTSLTNYTTLSLKAPDKIESVSSFSTLFLSDHSFLLVMRMQNGKAITKQIDTNVTINDDLLLALCSLLNNYVSGKFISNITLPTIMEMKKKLIGYDELIEKSIEAIYDVLGNQNNTNVQFEGVSNLLDYPEFADVEKIRGVMGMIEHKENFVNLISNSENDKVNVKLGNEDDNLVDDSALIYRTINVGGKVVGAIGVLGPSRMDYSKVISTVEFMTEKISNLLSGSLPPGDENKK